MSILIAAIAVSSLTACRNFSPTTSVYVTPDQSRDDDFAKIEQVLVSLGFEQTSLPYEVQDKITYGAEDRIRYLKAYRLRDNHFIQISVGESFLKGGIAMFFVGDHEPDPIKFQGRSLETLRLLTKSLREIFGLDRVISNW